MNLRSILRWRFYFLYLLLAILLIVSIGPSLLVHIKIIFSLYGLTYVIKNQWWAVAAYSILFTSVLFFLFKHPLNKTDWKKHSLYVAFIVALFAEMFGFPLTIYLLSPVLPASPVQQIPPIVFSGSVLNMAYNLEINTFVGLIVSLLAALLIITGWKQIYKAPALVTKGIYSYIRHPQYTGIMLIISTWALVWPTLFTILFWPILIFSYHRLALSEEKEMISKFGKKYKDYKEQVPAFLPYLKLAD